MPLFACELHGFSVGIRCATAPADGGHFAALTYCAITISEVLLTVMVEIFTNGTPSGTE